MPINTIESKAARVDRANYEMGEYLNRLIRNQGVPILRSEDYDWDAIQPNLVTPSQKKSLRFVAEVELPTDLYANQLIRSARKDGAVWLERMVGELWRPQERPHGILLREAAIRCGAVTATEFDRERIIINDPDFPLGRDYESEEATTYGRFQEYYGFKFYDAQERSIEEPIIKQVLHDIKLQEIIHCGIYDHGMRFASPEAIVRAMRPFKMPGHATSPRFQRDSNRWAQEFGFDYKGTTRGTVRVLLDRTGYEGLGEIVTSEAFRSGRSLPVRSALSVLDLAHNFKPVSYTVGRVAARVAGVERAKAA